MTAEELDDFYAREYRQFYQGDEGPTSKDLDIQTRRAASLLHFTKGNLSKVERHLDIGCSAGVLLKIFQNNYGCQAVGVEPGDSYRGYAQAQGYDVYADISELDLGAGGRFDLVSMAHVLEHITDPLAYLIALQENYLTKSGVLLLEVPNLYAHDSFETAHMSAFSKFTLVEILKQAGFSVIASKQHGEPRSKLLPLYRTAHLKVSTENFVRQKRKLGVFSRRVIQRLLPNMAWVPIEN
jgi:SAM-dependent methyltransferase